MHKYSQRLSWNFSSNSLSEQAHQRRLRGEPIIDLTKSNPTEVLDHYPHTLIAEAFGQINNFCYSPDPLGGEPARLAISRYYAQRDLIISPDRLLLTASTSEAYALLFKLFCDPSDEVLVPAPSYPLFEFLADLESVRVRPYRLEFDGAWYIDFSHLRKQINPSTRAIVIVNPNNPTGSFLKQHEFEMLRKLALTSDLPVISDEVFLDYSFGPSPNRVRSLIGHDECLSFSFNGLSKSAGMPQMKVAWIAVNGPEADRSAALQRLELIADTYLSIGTPVQNALPKLFEIGVAIQNAICARTQANLATLNSLLRNTPAHTLYCEGGWSAIIRLPATQSEECWTLRLLHEYGILVQPGYFFDMPSEPYIVVSLITPEEEFARGIALIHEISRLP